MEIEDLDGNGKYDVKDFLKLENSEILDMNKGKKFEVCLMNPPYDGNLHLKFLEKAVKVSDIVVSIEPAEWLARPYMKKSWEDIKNKYESIFAPRLKSLEMLDRGSNKYFDAGIDNELGIFEFNKNGGINYDNFYKSHDTSYLSYIDKFNTGVSLKDKIEVYDNQQYFVPLRADGIVDRWWTLQLINYLDIIVDGKVYSGDYKGKTIIQARESNPHENGRNNDRKTIGISFNSLNEAINFRDSLKLEAYLYIIYKFKTVRRNPLDKLPYLNDYTHAWTNEEIFDMFNVDKNIRNTIIDDMQIFMYPSKNFKYPKYDNI